MNINFCAILLTKTLLFLYLYCSHHKTETSINTSISPGTIKGKASATWPLLCPSLTPPFHDLRKVLSDKQHGQSLIFRFLLWTVSVQKQPGPSWYDWVWGPSWLSLSCLGNSPFSRAHMDLKVEIWGTGIQAVHSNLASSAIKLILLSIWASCLYVLIDQNPKGKGVSNYYFSNSSSC